MKTVYIPKGETVRYESLMTEHLVVHGCLQVSNGIKARTIAGQGTINAGSIDTLSELYSSLNKSGVKNGTPLIKI